MTCSEAKASVHVKREKIKIGGLDQYGAEPFEQE